MVRVAHCSDTQIRNFDRHEEYRKSYENLFESLKEKNPDVIVFAGDLAHSKTKISPEFVQLCSFYLKGLSNIAPTVVIPGNHDCNLQNLSRLDALTPIVENIGSKNIFYYKHSGIYKFNDDIDFIIFSCLDPDSLWPNKFEVNLNKLNIGIYHGFVQGAVLQNNMIVEDCPYSTKRFLDIVDYLLLGDIHKMQILDLHARAAYCGSYPQQNYGEDISKGYLLWDIKSKKEHNVDFVELPNVCPFYTLYLDENLNIIGNQNIQKNSRIRVFSRQLTHTEKKQIKDKITTFYSPERFEIYDNAVSKKEISLGEIDAKLQDVSDVGVQERLIRKFFEQDALDEILMSKILDINKKYSAQVKNNDDTLRNVQYALGKMSYNNLFSYGENNVFDFSKYKGAVGIFGKSAVGKSSLVVDIPLYILFNKISKNATRNDYIINHKKDNCAGSLDIILKDRTYKIERNTKVYVKSGKKEGTPVFQSKTSVNFTCTYPDGREEKLDGEQRNDTDSVIRQIFGTAEDFISTAIAPQWQLLNFIESGATDRQKLIGKYFDVDIFFKKHELSKNDLKETKGKLKLLQDKNFDLLISTAQSDLMQVNEQLESNKKNYELCNNEIKSLRQQIEELQAKSTLSLDVALRQLETKIFVLEKSLKEKELQSSSLKSEIKKQNSLIESLSKKVQNKDKQQLKKQIDEYQKQLKQFKFNYSDLGSIDGQLKVNEKKVVDLKKYTCITNSDCCMLQDLNKTHEELARLHKEKEVIIKDLGEQAEITNKLGKIQDVYEEIEEKEQELKDKKFTVKHSIEKFNIVDSHKKELAQELNSLQEQKQKILQDIESETYKRIKTIVEEKKTQLEELENKKSVFSKKSIDLATKLGAIREAYTTVVSQKKEYEQLKEEYDAYEYFMRAMSKDGIAKKIIADNLDIINFEIKKILSKGTSFDIVLESTEDGKAIDIWFEDNKNKRRLIELCSGFEKTLAALAIRAALLTITTLPKPNIFVLDEALGALDSEHISDFQKILDYLKQLFECVMIITHDDTLKDFVDHVVEIEKDSEGYSKIC